MFSNRVRTASHVFQIRNALIDTISIAFFSNETVINITSSHLRHLQNLQGQVGDIATRLEARDSNACLKITILRNQSIERFHNLLAEYSNQFGQDRNVANSVRGTLAMHNRPNVSTHAVMRSQTTRQGPERTTPSYRLPSRQNQVAARAPRDSVRTIPPTTSYGIVDLRTPLNPLLGLGTHVNLIQDSIIYTDLNAMLGPIPRTFWYIPSVPTRHATPEPSPGPNSDALEGVNIKIPEEYCCPLSFSIMTNPVYIQNDPTNKRFEAAWIRKWLNEHRSHPITRTNDIVADLIPDTELKKRIDEFVARARTPSQLRP
jgi:hypothetical protein